MSSSPSPARDDTVVASEPPQQPHEVLISGMLYDISNFKKHPGGSIIKFFAGHGDGTHAFQEFHSRSEIAQKWLETLPKRRAPIVTHADPKAALTERRYAKMTEDFIALRQKLEKEGWFDPNPVHVVYRLVELVLVHVLSGLLLAYFHTNPLAVFLAVCGIGIGAGRGGWLMHEAGHFSFFGNTFWDIKLQELVYGLTCGMSAAWWRNQHNKHHATPQKLKHDVDLDTLPFVAFNKLIAVKGKDSLSRFFVPLQAYIFTPIICSLVTSFWQHFLHPRHMFRTKHYFEMFAIAIRLTLHYVLWQATGWNFMSYLCIVYGGAIMTGGSYIFTNFAVSHTHLGVVDSDKDVHWLEYAAVYTMNCKAHPITNWWMGYLNFQIEHHLFPSMPQHRFPALSPQIKSLFERNGLKYDVRGYWEAMHDTFKNLNDVGKVLG